MSRKPVPRLSVIEEKRDRPDRRDADRKAEKSSGRAFKLSETEVAIIVKACTKYRHLLPTYIASVQDEIKTIDKIINKLSKS